MNNDNINIQEQQILDFLRPQCEIRASWNLRKKVSDTLNPQRKYKLLRWRLGGLSSVAAAVIVIILTLSPRISAKDIIKDALAFISDSFVVEFEARTLPTENFAYLEKNLPFTPITLSVSNNYWMIDKGGRKAMGNDSVRYMWLPEYLIGWVTYQTTPNFIEDFNRLLNPRQLLSHELSRPLKDLKVKKDGNYVVITSNAENLTYTYLFDKDSHRLISYTITGDNELLLRTTDISYTQSKPFQTALPDNIHWIDVTEMKGHFRGLSPTETAQIALAAFKNWQTDIIMQGFSLYNIDQLTGKYSGAILLSVGAAQQGTVNTRFSVPYRLKMKDGSIKNGNLSLEHQIDGSWIIDGGI